MELLKDDSLYKIIESEPQDVELINREIKRYMIENPTLVHETLNYLLSQADIYKAEYMRIQKLKSVKETNADLIKNIIIQSMQETDSKYVETRIGKLSLRKTPGSVVIKDITKIPEEYFKIEKSPKLKEIKDAYNAGLISNETIEIKQGYSLIKK